MKKGGIQIELILMVAAVIMLFVLVGIYMKIGPLADNSTAVVDSCSKGNFNMKNPTCVTLPSECMGDYMLSDKGEFKNCGQEKYCCYIPKLESLLA